MASRSAEATRMSTGPEDRIHLRATRRSTGDYRGPVYGSARERDRVCGHTRGIFSSCGPNAHSLPAAVSSSNLRKLFMRSCEMVNAAP